MVIFSRLRHYLGEGSVHPVHDSSLRSEIGGKRNRLQRDVPDSRSTGAKKQTNLSLAKAIDGLHGVSHRQHTAPVPRLPSRSQLFDQFILADRRILKLIYQ